MAVEGEVPEVSSTKTLLTAELKVKILFNNLIGVLETFELDDSPFSRGMLSIIKPCLAILAAETLEDLQNEVDEVANTLIGQKHNEEGNIG